MDRTILNAVGIPAKTDIPVGLLFGSKMAPETVGLTEDVAIRLSALHDFVKAYNDEMPIRTDKPITNHKQAAEAMHATLRQMDHEEVWVVVTDRDGYPIARKKVSSGDLEASCIDAKQVIKATLGTTAKGVILYHNHPSGNPNPSTADIKRTEDLRNALNVFDLLLIDHIVISDTRYFSFSADGVFKFERNSQLTSDTLPSKEREHP